MAIPQYKAGGWASGGYAEKVVDYFLERVRAEYPELLSLLGPNAEEAIQKWPNLSLSLTDDGDPEIVRSDCSTSGLYIWGQRRSRIIVARSPSRGRNAFTILHELSHHLQRSDPEWLDVLSDLSDNQARTLEHLVCDEFASEILMPRASISKFVGVDRIAAAGIRDLYEQTHASRAAAIVRTRPLLPLDSVSLLLADDGTLVFSQSRGELVAPSRQGEVTGNLLEDALSRVGGEAAGSVNFKYETGTFLEGIAATAAVDYEGRYVFVVATKVDRYDEIKTEWKPTVVECPCGESFASNEALSPCARCKGRICPFCERCYCASGKNSTVCTVCWTELSSKEAARGLTVHEDCG
ncbi:ImmA/IrrE family metallo-endopeptidase [Amycolatopsis circi]|uniref:ImmA/IrrE family metallo-endopeptidase n=1 Tax=Amycolatopsis circi TaxID=871959 RepID=UPI000E25F61E|nr:ImmA/IrrE family metallo-endopeptidase [Amycolatopsis circi]